MTGDSVVVSVDGSQRRRWAEKRRVPVLIVLAFLVGYICVGAVVFSTWEEWTFLDGAYFSFITRERMMHSPPLLRSHRRHGR